jgi:hypothetical protein
MKRLSRLGEESVNTQYGLEPTFVFAIDFTDQFIISPFGASPTPQSIADQALGSSTVKFWSDKIIYESDQVTVLYPGKIIEMGPINSFAGFDGNSASSDLTVKIDDSDLSILGMLQNFNIQKVPAYVYMYFPGMGPGDLIPVFEGVIVSGFKWSDKDKTATFTVLNTVIEREVGFSPEQGYITDLPLNMIGKPWPFGYGTVIKYPGLQINYSPTAITTVPFGIVDWSLNNEIARLQSLQGVITAIAQLDFFSALGAYFSGDQSLGDQLTDEGNAALLEYSQVQTNQLSIQDILAEQTTFAQDQTVITNCPKSLTGIFSIGDTVLCQGELQISGGSTVVGNTAGVGTFHYIGPYFPTGGQFFLPNYSPAQVQPFYFIQAGATIKYLGNLPTTYTGASTFDTTPLTVQPDYPLKFAINCLGGTIDEVYAYKTVEGVHRLFNVPKAYWTTTNILSCPDGIVSTVPIFNVLAVFTKRPLSSFLNEFWDDQVYVSYTSAIGPGLVSIITYLITTYTNYTFDSGSLGTLEGFNCSFATVEQKDIMTQLKEILFQCSTAVWLSEGVFHFLYLPSQPGSAASIGLSDVIADTLEIGITTTENIITKIKAAWFYTYELDTRNYYQARYNDFRYGIHELDVDYYCFQDLGAIAESVNFWLYRKGNTWKRLKFSVPIKFISLSIFDVVTLGSDVNNLYKLGVNGQTIPASVVGISINPDTYVIDLELELPIYVGSTKNSPAYWMSNYGGPLYNIDEAFNLTETPQQTAAYKRGASIANTVAQNEILLEAATQFGGGANGYPLSQPDPVGGDYTPQGLSIFTRTDSGAPSFGGGSLGPATIPVMSQKITPQYPPPIWNYAYADYPTTQASGGGAGNPGCIPGQILDLGNDGYYDCQVYPQGLANGTPITINATLLQDAKNDNPIPAGTWALFSVVAGPDPNASPSGILSEGSNTPSTNDDGNFYYFQVPVWLG